MLNKVMLIGRLGRDPELKFTGTGKAVANFLLATDESRKDANGKSEKRTEWHKIVAWEKLAETCQKHLKKGSLVYIEGKLETRHWDKEGQKRTSTEIICGEMRMLDAKPDHLPAGRFKNRPRITRRRLEIFTRRAVMTRVV
jgi:single-strand DNA-binding protein